MKALLNTPGVYLGFALVWSAFGVPAFAGHLACCAVPEVDAGALAGGLAIVVGGYLVVLSRIRRK
jgi:hypothetical protein